MQMGVKASNSLREHEGEKSNTGRGLLMRPVQISRGCPKQTVANKPTAIK